MALSLIFHPSESEANSQLSIRLKTWKLKIKHSNVDIDIHFETEGIINTIVWSKLQEIYYDIGTEQHIKADYTVIDNLSPRQSLSPD